MAKQSKIRAAIEAVEALEPLGEKHWCSTQIEGVLQTLRDLQTPLEQIEGILPKPAFDAAAHMTPPDSLAKAPEAKAPEAKADADEKADAAPKEKKSG